MTNRLLFVITCAVFFFCLMQVSLAQKPGEESGLFIEENIEAEFKTELPRKIRQPPYISTIVILLSGIKKISCTKREK